MIQLQGISAGYGGPLVVQDVTLDLIPGEVLVLLGPNGCGKSTLLRVTAGLQPPAAGQVLVDGVETALEAITLTDSSGNGYTYFKVRDLGQALGFDVTWDSAAGAIVIDTTRPYSGT